MRYIYVLTLSLVCLISAQDEFFDSGYTIGGYGELHWNKEFVDGEATKNQMDFHRFIIYYGYNWTEKWSFKSEVELEHNYVRGNNDLDYDFNEHEITYDSYGELELEQAFVNYHAGNWGFQGGVILPTAGMLNEYHEPPLFLSVERPDYSKYIMPTTWFGNGFALYGSMPDLNVRLVFMEDLEGEGISSSGIRSGRGKGYKTTGYSLTKNISASYTGISGLRTGFSLTMNDAPINNDPDTTISVQMVEVNGKYNANNIYVAFEYGTNAFEGNNYESPLKSSSGYYIDLGYNIGDMVGCGKLMPWFRMSQVAKNDDDDSKIYDFMRFGLTWWPIDNVAFKMDYGTKTKKSDTSNPDTQFNLGIGYSF